MTKKSDPLPPFDPAEANRQAVADGTYINPERPSAERSLMKKQVVNVCDVGADASGRSNSIEAFQRALNHLRFHGGEVLIPAGKYRLSGKLELNAETDQTEPLDSVGE